MKMTYFCNNLTGFDRRCSSINRLRSVLREAKKYFRDVKRKKG